MEFKKLSAPTLKQLFTTEIESMILSGKLPIGTKLPSERELANTMQISRAVVNAGIVDLSRKGFISMQPRIGNFVADYRKNGTIETFHSIVSYHNGKLRKEELKSILELRIALDTLALNLLRNELTEDNIIELKEIIKKLSIAKTSEEAVSLAFDFQHCLALFSGNTLLPILFISFKSVTKMLWLRFCDLYGIEVLYQNTKSFFNKIEQRDFDGAIQNVNNTIEKSISGDMQIYY